jgi:Predicted pPIWI-associating nuclease
VRNRNKESNSYCRKRLSVDSICTIEVATKTLDWDVMGCAFFGRAPAFVVNLGGGDVAVTEQFLHLPNIDAGIEEQGSGGRPEGMRAVEPRTFLDRPRQLRHVAGNDSVHASLAYGLVTKLIAVGRAAGPEHRPGRKSSFPKVLGKSRDYGLDDLDEALMSISAHLLEVRRGAWTAIASSQPDSFRQAAHSARELIDQVLKEAAPDDLALTDAEFKRHASEPEVTIKDRRKFLKRKFQGEVSESDVRIADKTVDLVLELRSTKS